MPSIRAHVLLVFGLAAPLAAQPPSASADSSLTRWARTHAIPLASVDQPYTDSAYAFVRPLAGTARLLALGEVIHGGHEPLAFRNQVIEYAITKLGFTGVAVESGLTDSDVIDDYIHGGSGNVDSVVQAGLTYGFGSLPENRDLVVWLRAYNAHATRPVSFYGVDLTGGEDFHGAFPGAPQSITAALAYLARVAPSAAAGLRSQLNPLVDRFTPLRYPTLTAAEQTQLRGALDSLHRVLQSDSSRYVRATSPRSYARAVRDAWMAVRFNDVLSLHDTTVFNGKQGALRDSTIAENTAWALAQQGPHGRLIFFAHDGHILNALADFRAANTTYRGLGGWKMAGRYLRSWYGKDYVIVPSTASSTIVRTYFTNGAGGSPSDSMSIDAAFARVGRSPFIVDLRAADRDADVATALAHPWPFRIQTYFLDAPPREAADAIVYFDRITPSKDNLHDVDPKLMLYSNDPAVSR
jgi:erythromycin esterase